MAAGEAGDTRLWCGCGRERLTRKFEGSRSTFHKVHFHLFRKFFLTKGSDIIGEHAAHALIGRSFYMDACYRESGERGADSSKLMPYLTVPSLARPAIEDVGEKIERQMLRAVGSARRRWRD